MEVDVAGGLVASPVLNYFYHRRKMRLEMRAHRDNWDWIAGSIQERFSAVRVVRAFNREKSEIAAFAAGIETDFLSFTRIVRHGTRLSAIAELLASTRKYYRYIIEPDRYVKFFSTSFIPVVCVPLWALPMYYLSLVTLSGWRALKSAVVR